MISLSFNATTIKDKNEFAKLLNDCLNIRSVDDYPAIIQVGNTRITNKDLQLNFNYHNNDLKLISVEEIDKTDLDK